MSSHPRRCSGKSSSSRLTEQKRPRHAGVCAKPACKPGSVGVSSPVTVIPLGPGSPLGSSHLPADSASSVVIRLLGVAPGGGCRVSPRRMPGGLVSVALFLALGRPMFAHRPAYGVRALPGTLLYGARTFLHAAKSRTATVRPTSILL